MDLHWCRSAARMRQQFIHPERFGEVIVGAEIERLDLAGSSPRLDSTTIARRRCGRGSCAASRDLNPAPEVE